MLTMSHICSRDLKIEVPKPDNVSSDLEESHSRLETRNSQPCSKKPDVEESENFDSTGSIARWQNRTSCRRKIWPMLRKRDLSSQIGSGIRTQLAPQPQRQALPNHSPIPSSQNDPPHLPRRLLAPKDHAPPLSKKSSRTNTPKKQPTNLLSTHATTP